MNTCPNCGMVKGMHGSILPGCMCPWTSQQPDQFRPDWNTEAVLVEEMQRMAKRIEDLEAMLERQTARIVDLQTHIENFDGEDR